MRKREEQRKIKSDFILEEAGFKRYDAQLYYREIDTAPRRYIISFNPLLFVDERRLRQRRFDKLTQFVQQKNQMLSQVKRSVNEAALRRSLGERLKGLRKFFGLRLIPLMLRAASG